MEVVVLWVAFGLLCAVIAPGRGRSGFAWFLLGFAFGPFGLIALLALGRVDDVPLATGPAEHSHDTRACPWCAETIKIAAVVCKHCGRDVEAPQPAAARVVTPSRCPSCATFQKPGAQTCPSCGTDFRVKHSAA